MARVQGLLGEWPGHPTLLQVKTCKHTFLNGVQDLMANEATEPRSEVASAAD